MKKNGFAPLIIILVIAILGAVGYFMYKNSLSKIAEVSPSSSPAQNKLQISTKHDQNFVVNIPEGYKIYASDKLGINFFYSPAHQGPVKEVGNKIYADYRVDNGAVSGQYVQVFNKDLKETFSDAIKSRILSGYPLDKCQVVVTGNENNTEFNAEIVDSTAEVTPVSCPSDYSKTNGERFFYYDSNHADKFLFYEIGQYGPFWYVEFK